MTTYKTERETLLKLKGFFREFRRTKRGVFGLTVISGSIIVAILGPMLTALDPLYPQWPGYYPAGPVTASYHLCVPIWYRNLPEGDKYSENMEAITDHTFSLSETLASKWKQEISNNLIEIAYNSEKGTQNDGCVVISYNRSSDTPVPLDNRITISYDFRYPFKNPPKQFWIHTSYLVDGTVSKDCTVSLNFLFYRKDALLLENYGYNQYKDFISTEDSMTVYTYPLITYPFIAGTQHWINTWTRSTNPAIFRDKKYFQHPEEVIFPTAGNYTLTIELKFDDKGNGKKDVAIYLDNINVLIYGDSFGLLGSDGIQGQSRDIFTALLHGARVSVIVGILSAVLSVSIGLMMGMIAGYIGGLTDEAIMRFADFLIGLPGLPLLIVLAVILTPSIWNIVLILSFMGWMGFSRSIRSMTLSLRERAFVEAAKASGAGRSRIVFRHILPNVIPLVYLSLATSVPAAIVTEASLSFLGLFDPSRITWGRMLNEFASSGVAMTKGFEAYWFWVLPPGIGISALAISFILMGYSLDEILNPKLRQRQ